MEQDASFDRYRAASRRALFVSVLLLVAVTCALVWNARGLQEVDSEIAELEQEKTRLDGEMVRLTEELRALQDAPDGGVRVHVLQVENIESEMYDFTVWVDVADFSKSVTEVGYEFAGEGYGALSSTLKETGFAAYFRGPVRAGQDVCPGETRVTVTFEDGSNKSINQDLCAAAGIDVP